MIDAYEIGIQLALQDDVSGGLAIISRDLADVDRAIAATNAGLVQLVRSAAGASKAVTGLGQGQKTPEAGNTPEQLGLSADVPIPDRREPSSSPTASGEHAELPRPALRKANDATGDVGTTSSGTSVAPDAHQTDPAGKAEATVQQQVSVQAPVVVHQAETSSVAPSTAAAARVQPLLPGTQSTPKAEALQARLSEPAAAPDPDRAGRATRPAPTAPRLISASLAARAMPSRDGEGPKEAEVVRLAHAGLNQPTSKRAATASWPSTEPGQGALRPTGPAERAVAPQPAPREQSEMGGGTVMLDGRLVGYWLSEQMARDASRPPSGTTFFDPKQTPAWTASGTL